MELYRIKHHTHTKAGALLKPGYALICSSCRSQEGIPSYLGERVASTSGGDCCSCGNEEVDYDATDTKVRIAASTFIMLFTALIMALVVSA